MSGRPKLKKLVLWNVSEQNIPTIPGNINSLSFPMDRQDMFEEFGGAEWQVISHSLTPTDKGLLLSLFLEQEIPPGGVED